MISLTDKSKLEEIIYSEEEAIKELLEVQQLLRKQKEAYIQRSDRQYDEVNTSIDLHQSNIKKLKSQLK